MPKSILKKSKPRPLNKEESFLLEAEEEFKQKKAEYQQIADMLIAKKLSNTRENRQKMITAFEACYGKKGDAYINADVTDCKKLYNMRMKNYIRAAVANPQSYSLLWKIKQAQNSIDTDVPNNSQSLKPRVKINEDKNTQITRASIDYFSPFIRNQDIILNTLEKHLKRVKNKIEKGNNTLVNKEKLIALHELCYGTLTNADDYFHGNNGKKTFST